MTICEQEMQSLKCEAGQTITVLTAMYGRKKDSVCPSKPIHSLNCEARSSLTKVKEACEGKDTCVLSAVNSVFGDPCRGTTKYLEVTYTCEGRGKCTMTLLASIEYSYFYCRWNYSKNKIWK